MAGLDHLLDRHIKFWHKFTTNYDDVEIGPRFYTTAFTESFFSLYF